MHTEESESRPHFCTKWMSDIISRFAIEVFPYLAVHSYVYSWTFLSQAYYVQLASKLFISMD